MSLSEASERRLDVARTIAASYAAEATVVAVLCAGSAARGEADRWSDLELLVVWENAPDDQRRLAVIRAAAGYDARLWNWDEHDQACSDEWWHGGPAGSGLLVEVTHSTPDALQARVAALVGGRPDPALLTLGDALVNGLPLVGRARAEAWRAQLVPYPRRLAVEVTRQLGQIDHFWRWRMYYERGNLLQLRAHFVEVAVRVVHIGSALSGVWWPGAKWLIAVARRLPVAPAGLADRLQKVASEQPAEAAATLEALVEETYDLVEEHLPEVDVTRLRSIFHFARRPDS